MCNRLVHLNYFILHEAELPDIILSLVNWAVYIHVSQHILTFMGRFVSFCFGTWRHQNAAKTLNLRNLGQNSDISKMFTVRITATANRATTGELIPSRVQQTYKSSRRQRTHITRSTSKKNNGGVKDTRCKITNDSNLKTGILPQTSLEVVIQSSSNRLLNRWDGYHHL